MNGDEKTQHPVPGPVTAPVAVEEASGHSGEGAGFTEAERAAQRDEYRSLWLQAADDVDQTVTERDVLLGRVEFWRGKAQEVVDYAEREAAAIAERDAALAEVGRLRDGIKELAHDLDGLTYPAHAMQAANDHAAQMTAERDAARDLAATLEAEVARVTEGVRALAEDWRYKGEFGWGAWQEGHGPDQEGCVLDECSGRLRALLAPTEDQP